MVTIKDVQEYTHISAATISRALRNPQSVSPEKLQIIQAAVKELGYVPNYYASNLKAKNGQNIGFIINDVQNPFFNNLIRSIEYYLSQEQFKLLISFGLDENDSIEDKLKTLLSSSVSGILFSPNTSDPAIEKLLHRQGVYSLQLFTRAYDSLDSIVVDDYNGTYLATKRLLHAGHTNILIIGFDDLACQSRINGYRQAHIDGGLTPQSRNIFLLDSKESLPERIGTKIIAEAPTAIIVISDMLGVHTIKALKKLSISIPDDMSLILYDDTAWADLMDITAIGHPIDVLGRTIAQTIISSIKSQPPHAVLNQTVEPLIIERNSIKNIK